MFYLFVHLVRPMEKYYKDKAYLRGCALRFHTIEFGISHESTCNIALVESGYTIDHKVIDIANNIQEDYTKLCIM